MIAASAESRTEAVRRRIVSVVTDAEQNVSTRRLSPTSRAPGRARRGSLSLVRRRAQSDRPLPYPQHRAFDLLDINLAKMFPETGRHDSTNCVADKENCVFCAVKSKLAIHHYSFAFLPESVPRAGLEADRLVHRRVSQPRLI